MSGAHDSKRREPPHTEADTGAADASQKDAPEVQLEAPLLHCFDLFKHDVKMEDVKIAPSRHEGFEGKWD